MDTLETAKQTKTAYFIEYVYPIDAYGKQSFYFQLVRTKDCAILYAVWKTLLPIAPGRRLTPTGMRLKRCKA